MKISNLNKTWIEMNLKPTPHDKIKLEDVERLLLECGFKKRKSQSGSHRRYKLEGVSNSFVQLSGHGKNPTLKFYQVIQVIELLEELDLIREEI